MKYSCNKSYAPWLEYLKNMPKRPGLETERAYYDWLAGCIDGDPNYYHYGICDFRWDSLTEKTSYDFAVDTDNYDGRLFIDCVGYRINPSGSIRLNTAHKDFKAMLKELSDPDQCDWHDCFKAYQVFFYGEWLYLPVTDHMPRGDITLDR